MARGISVKETGSGFALPLSCGTEMTLEPLVTKGLIKAKLIGIEEGRYLILKLPPGIIVGGRHELTDCPFVVKYVHEGSVFGFRAAAICYSTKPDRLLFIEYPASVEEYAARGETRLACRLAASLELDGVELPAVILNISSNGCLCVMKARPADGLLKGAKESGRALRLTTYLPGDDAKLSLTVAVRHVAVHDNLPSIGIRFEGIDGDAALRLSSFLDAIRMPMGGAA